MQFYNEKYKSNSDIKSELIAIAITGGIIGTLTLGIRSCKAPKNVEEPYETISTTDKIFAPGEHIIAVPITNPLKTVNTYEGHQGYKPIGISAATFGKTYSQYDYGYIMFENIVEVKASATSGNNKDSYRYDNFGTPIDYEINEYSENIYDTYQHIVSVPYEIDNARVQIEFVDGYEIVGVASSSYGEYIGSSAGDCILYTNTEPVEYIYEENDTFGKPIEKVKTKEK